MNKLKLCFISDTHTQHDQVNIPDCDILIHTGDATYLGKQHEVESFSQWFRQLPIKHKVYVPGNHDRSFEWEPEDAKNWLGFEKSFKDNYGSCYLLNQEMIEIEGLKIYGDPRQPRFGNPIKNWAFNVDRGEPLREVWELIPEDADVVATHGPAFGILDWAYYSSENAGCRDLMERLYQVQPLIHACGHIHESFGWRKPDDMRTLFINASTCTLEYNPTNSPILVEVYQEDNSWKVDVPTYSEVSDDSKDI